LIGDDDTHRRQAVMEARSEALRLLYVALTRAEQAVFVGWREADHIAGESALADLLHRGRDAQAPCQRLAQAYPHAIAIEAIDMNQPATAAEFRLPSDIAALAAARRDLPSARPHWSTYSFSRLAKAVPEAQTTVLPEPGAEDEATDLSQETAEHADD